MTKGLGSTICVATTCSTMEQAWQNYQEKLTRLDSKLTTSLPTKEVHIMCSMHSVLSMCGDSSNSIAAEVHTTQLAVVLHTPICPFN